MSAPAFAPARLRELEKDLEFRMLLTAASDATGEALDSLIEGLVDHDLLVATDALGELCAIAVSHRLDGHAVEIDYLAVDPGQRKSGLATAAVHLMRRQHAAMVVASTDDDAIGFYRATGFQCSVAPSDPRWPGRARYLCVLPYLPLLRDPESSDGPVEWIHGAPTPVQVRVLPASTAWPKDFAALAERLRLALGSSALAIEHLGSTSVPGLAAKPVIDVVLSIADPDNEDDYVRALEAAGFTFRLREPHWYRHRLLVPNPGTGLASANVHVFAPGCPETAKMRAMRDWLRTHDGDRDAYARIKQITARRTNENGGGVGLVMDYNKAKEPFILELYHRILNEGAESEEV